MKGDRAIREYHGDLGIERCYEKARSLGNRVFAVQDYTRCYTTSTAGDTYRKYGSTTNCDKYLEVYEIQNGNLSYLYIYTNIMPHYCNIYI